MEKYQKTENPLQHNTTEKVRNKSPRNGTQSALLDIETSTLFSSIFNVDFYISNVEYFFNFLCLFHFLLFFSLKSVYILFLYGHFNQNFAYFI